MKFPTLDQTFIFFRNRKITFPGPIFDQMMTSYMQPKDLLNDEGNDDLKMAMGR